MDIRDTTPFGFLDTDVEKGSHIMYEYARKDEAFIRNVVGFITAGVSAGEMVGCAMDASTCSEIERSLVARGVGMDPSDPTTQVFLSDTKSVFLHDGLFCAESTARYCRRLLSEADSRGMGLRIVSDSLDASVSKVTRMKLLEYEALWPSDMAFTVALSTYEASAPLKSFLTEVRRIHPLIATDKGLRRNRTHMDPKRFLSSFYRYQRVTKEYPTAPTSEWSVISDFEEIAARTPLSAVEISSFRTALGLLLVHSVGGFSYHGVAAPVLGRRFQVSYSTESDKMIVAVHYHAPGIQNERPDYRQFIENGRILSEGLADDLRIEVWPDTIVVTMVKAYTDPLAAARTD